ncbi:hypothetical protein CHUAL_006036 [Chamberlinius hualienensis]
MATSLAHIKLQSVALKVNENIVINLNVDENTAQELENDHIQALKLLETLCLSGQLSTSKYLVFKWEESATKLLIELVGEKKAFLSRQEKLKMEIWKEISSQMFEQNIDVPWTIVAKKWANLLDRYKKISAKSYSTGNQLIKWPFYKIINEMFIKCNPNSNSFHSTSLPKTPPEVVEEIPQQQKSKQETEFIPKDKSSAPSWMKMYLDNKKKLEKESGMELAKAVREEAEAIRNVAEAIKSLAEVIGQQDIKWRRNKRNNSNTNNSSSTERFKLYHVKRWRRV